MLRVRAITPIDVPSDELARRQRRYDLFSPPGVVVTLDNIGPGAPTTLDSADDIRASDRRVAELACATDPERFDVVLPDCVLDPGVGAPSAVPVVGLLRLAAGHAEAMGAYGSVTRNAAIGDELTHRLGQYGLDGAYVGNDVLALDFDAIADDARWRAAITTARGRLAERGATTVLNGCSAVDIADEDVGVRAAVRPLAGGDAGVRAAVRPLAGGDVVVFDPTRLALALLGAGRRAGLHRGRA